MPNKSMVFRTQLSGDTDKYKSRSGSKLLAKYALKIDEKSGYEYLAPTGEFENVYDRIQADYPSTDINILMERFALGDTSAINVRQGFYADATTFPKTYAEVFQAYNDCQLFFEELPTDVKEMFDNSFSVFFTEMTENPKSFDSKIEKYNSRFDFGSEFNVDVKEEKGEE